MFFPHLILLDQTRHYALQGISIRLNNFLPGMTGLYVLTFSFLLTFHLFQNKIGYRQLSLA